jgi:hypothetical protein
MATFTRANGGALAGEFFGRDLKWVKCTSTSIETGYTAADSDLEKVARILSKYSTISVVGTPASNNVMFVVEGLPTTVGDSSADQSGGTAIVAQLNADANVSLGSSAARFTVYSGLSGNTFA